MDLFTVSIVLVVSVVVCLFLLLVFKFDIREKSYEEALAEQRQQNHAFVPKVKTKEKKNKKAAKKVKEQEPAVVQEKVDEPPATNTPTVVKPHVEFKPTPENVEEIIKKKPVKKEKVKPILLNREKSSENLINFIVDSTPVNNFETLHPKDDFELKRANSKDELIKTEALKIKEVIEPESVKNIKKPLKTNIQPANVTLASEKPKIEVQQPQTLTNGTVPNIGKEKKKKKSEFNTLQQQITAERDGLINLVRKAELSRSDVQILIDLLLNKQQDAPEITSEWSEGKFDPVQRLKKQLAETEKALAEEQTALAGTQVKLREIRAEQQQDRLQLQQKIRGLEEVLQAKQMEIQASNNRLQIDVRKLQAQLNDELLRNHQLREELNKLHQFGVTHTQENDKIMGQLRNEIEELQQRNQRLQMEIHLVNEEKQKTQAYIVQCEHTVEINRQLEENKKDLERNLEKLLRERSEWKTENVKIQSIHQQQAEEKERLKQELYQLHQEHKQLVNNNNDNAKLILQLRNELKIAQEEKLTQMNGTSEESKAHKIELLNLTNELSSLKIEKHALQQLANKYESELMTWNEKCNKLQIEVEEQKSKNNELRTKNWKVMEALNAAENKLNSSTKQKDVNTDDIIKDIRNKEQENQIKFIQSLFPDIQALNSIENNSNWRNEASTLIKTYVNNLQKEQKQSQSTSEETDNEEIVRLQAQLQYYKKLIDDTDNILNNIERNVQEEEIKWRSQLADKETELSNLKEQVLLPLRDRVAFLENEVGNRERIQILGDKNNISEVLVQKLSDAQNYNSFSSNGPVS